MAARRNPAIAIGTSNSKSANKIGAARPCSIINRIPKMVLFCNPTTTRFATNRKPVFARRFISADAISKIEQTAGDDRELPETQEATASNQDVETTANSSVATQNQTLGNTSENASPRFTSRSRGLNLIA